MRFSTSRFLAQVILCLALAGQARSQSGYLYIPVDFPGALSTQAFGIDSRGDVVGQYSVSTPGGPVPLVYRGFVRFSNGTYRTLDDPANHAQGSANGISDSGVVVGTYSNAGFKSFVFSGNQFNTFGVDGYETLLAGISSDNQMVGTLTPQSVGFYRSATGAISKLPVIAGENIQPAAVNLQGVIVGSYYTQIGTQKEGFILPPGGTAKTVVYPGSTNTWLTGINNQGTIAGYASLLTGNSEGFVMRDASLEVLSFPGSSQTRTGGINRSGVVVGTYFDAMNMAHGFIATPLDSRSANFSSAR
jgi:hypothetical protein